MATRNRYTWTTINVSMDTYHHLRKLRGKKESMNEVIRKLIDLPVPDTSRPRARRIYYEEDKE